MQLPKIAVVITETYPFIGSETTWKDELTELNRNFEKVIYCPIKYGGKYVDGLSGNAIALNSECAVNKPSSIVFLLTNLRLIVSILIFEQRRSRRFLLHIRSIRFLIASMKSAFIRAEFIRNEVQKMGYNLDDAAYYSTWMNSGALSLAILKKRKQIPNFIFRVNGFDFMDERHQHGHVFFRSFIIEQAFKVAVLSTDALKYLVQKGYDAKKLAVNYGGKYKRPLNKLPDTERFVIVSCSNMLPLKRVPLIVEALSQINDFSIEWYHFGTGVEFEKVKQAASGLPDNIKANIEGYVSQETIDEFYHHQQVNLFLHLSSMEGLGMAIIEAQRFGVAAIACSAGGVTDIVNESTGILLPVHCNASDVSAAIKMFRNSEKNTASFRNEVQRHFESKFGVEINSQNLFRLLTESQSGNTILQN